MPYEILRDTREQHGWDFALNQYCIGVKDATLLTGDYTITGYENILCIERKGSTSEFAKNVFEKRFTAELERMEKFKYPFIICEFTMDDIMNFPKGSSIPIKLWSKLKMTNFLLLKKYLEIEVIYRTKIILAGTHGKNIASSIFKRVSEYEQRISEESCKEST
jgi:ERCC4-type nuclease